MTDAEWAELERYYRDLAERLGLREWQLRVSREQPIPPEGETVDEIDAQTRITETGAYATLRVHAGFREGRLEDQRETILHELIHLFLEHLYDDAIETLSGLSAPQTSAVALALLNRQYERVVNRLAAAIAPMYPLPDWPVEAAAQEDRSVDDQNEQPEDVVEEQPAAEGEAAEDEAEGEAEESSEESEAEGGDEAAGS